MTPFSSRYLLTVCLLSTTILVSACAQRSVPAPVIKINTQVAETDRWAGTRTHTVQQGETLYGIAWLYGKDYQELASINGLAEPYQINSGETLNLIGNSNNIGEKTFTFKDYMSFSGGMNAIFKGNFSWKGGDFSQFMESRDLLTSRQKFGALNITKTATSKLDIAGYAIFSNTNTSSFIENINEYNTFTEEKTNKTVFKTKNIHSISDNPLKLWPLIPTMHGSRFYH